MRTRATRLACGTAALLAGAAVLTGARSPDPPRAYAAASPGRAAIRLNQVGYDPADAKRAYVLTQRQPGSLRFEVVRPGGAVALRSRSRTACGRWNARWLACRIIDLSGLRTPGTYRVRVGATLSPPFRVRSRTSLYAPLADGAVEFLEAQRDGPQVIADALQRRPAHAADANARVYAIPRYRDDQLAGPLRAGTTTVDLSGGWFDAGDYLKFSGTASFTDVMLLFTLREYGARLSGAGALASEARFGTDWLLRTWDARRKVLYEQVGLGDGNGDTVLGDHDVWRLPQADAGYRDPSLRYLVHRPVFAANRAGAPVSPNLAGREAAAFALCAQVFGASDPAYAHRCLLAGQTLYAAAATSWRGPLAGSVPASYYAEPEWRDDMELAAIELYLATLHYGTSDLPQTNPYRYFLAASLWADRYMSSSQAGEDALNLYDVAALAHFDLYRAMVATHHTTDLWTNASDVRGDMHDQLGLAAQLARTGPFGLADPAIPTDTVSHALGYASEARLYAAMTGDRSFERFAEQQLSWVLGANPWGTTFVVSAGSLFPHCLSHQVANLAGSLNGTPPVLTGAVVDGPTGAGDVDPLGAPDGYRNCTALRSFYRSFDGRGFRYLDSVLSSSTSEPSDDIVALSLLAFAQESAGLPRAGAL